MLSVEKREELRSKLMKMVKTDDPFKAFARIRSLFEIEDRGLDDLPEVVHDADAIATARSIYENHDTIQIDSDAGFSANDDGTWVQAWVFVEWEEIQAYVDDLMPDTQFDPDEEPAPNVY